MNKKISKIRKAANGLSEIHYIKKYYCFVAAALVDDEAEVFKLACFLPALMPVAEDDEFDALALTFFDDADVLASPVIVVRLLALTLLLLTLLFALLTDVEVLSMAALFLVFTATVVFFTWLDAVVMPLAAAALTLFVLALTAAFPFEPAEAVVAVALPILFSVVLPLPVNEPDVLKLPLPAVELPLAVPEPDAFVLSLFPFAVIAASVLPLTSAPWF